MNRLITLNQETSSVKYLCLKDKRLAKIIDMIGEITYHPHEDGYSFLIHEIIEQMLSIKAGQKIYNNLLNLCNGMITPISVSQLSDNQIKEIGTSYAKVEYIKYLTTAILSDTLILSNLPLMTDLEVIKELTTIRGIGNWTAKMYLIFVLDRPDILPFEDAAFLQSYCWLYKTTDRSQKSIKKKCNKWKPYSSIAARYLYRALDNGLTKREFHLYK